MPNGPQVNTPPPSLKPEDAELYQVRLTLLDVPFHSVQFTCISQLSHFPFFQSQIAAANALAQNGDLPPVHLPPPPINQVIHKVLFYLLQHLDLNMQGYDGQQRGGYQHHDNHTDRPPPGYNHHRGHHNNFKNRLGNIMD